MLLTALYKLSALLSYLLTYSRLNNSSSLIFCRRLLIYFARSLVGIMAIFIFLHSCIVDMAIQYICRNREYVIFFNLGLCTVEDYLMNGVDLFFQESRMLKFWFAYDTVYLDKVTSAYEFFKELVRPDQFPRGTDR